MFLFWQERKKKRKNIFQIEQITIKKKKKGKKKKEKKKVAFFCFIQKKTDKCMLWFKNHRVTCVEKKKKKNCIVEMNLTDTSYQIFA